MNWRKNLSLYAYYSSYLQVIYENVNIKDAVSELMNNEFKAWKWSGT